MRVNIASNYSVKDDAGTRKSAPVGTPLPFSASRPNGSRPSASKVTSTREVRRATSSDKDKAGLPIIGHRSWCSMLLEERRLCRRHIGRNIPVMVARMTRARCSSTPDQRVGWSRSDGQFRPMAGIRTNRPLRSAHMEGAPAQQCAPSGHSGRKAMSDFLGIAATFVMQSVSTKGWSRDSVERARPLVEARLWTIENDE